MSSEYGKIYTQGLFQTVAIYCHKFPAQLSFNEMVPLSV